MRRTDIQRDSKPASHILYEDANQKAALEARNGLIQFDDVVRLIEEAKRGFKLRLPDQIVSNREPYYKALDAADAAWASGTLDVSVMEQLVAEMLANQLSSVIDAARG
jgi:hypothetical protein